MFFSFLEGSFPSVSFQPGANPRKLNTHFLRATVEAEFPVTGGLGPLTASRPFPRTCGAASRTALDRIGLQVSPGSPCGSPSLHPVLFTMLRKAATPLSGAPDHPAGKKKDKWGIF